MSLMKCHKVIAFTISELLRENQKEWGGGGDGKITTTTKIMVKILFLSYVISGGVINSRFFKNNFIKSHRSNS